jgi:hypothetical protein
MNDPFDEDDIEWDEAEPNGAEPDDTDDDDLPPLEGMVHDSMNVVEFDFDDDGDAADEDAADDADDELGSTLNR